MWLVFKIPLVLMSLYTSVFSNDKVFKEYCWGCHHQTSVAFGPSFEEIASKRTYGEIQGHIIAPRSTYIQLGYKRSVMPSFKDKLTIKQLDEITNFIISFKKED
ncbi:c-type cytochrome [Malaciobacter mytili]|uniref:c-type cytochrome n=1 Tax=Malaciobacter mytili TaxID=603050 RepID=UPI003A852A7A